MVFLTTNHPERIDEAAIRSGRVDFRLELTRCDREQLARMCRKFFDDEAAAARFADAVEPDRWSPAQVQERLLKAAGVDEAIASFPWPGEGLAVVRAALTATTATGAAPSCARGRRRGGASDFRRHRRRHLAVRR